MKNRAVIYLRVSTAYQESEGSSLSAQEAACLEYAASKKLKVVDVIREQVSGRKETLDRPGLLRALGYLDRKEADHFVVWSLDRFSRNVHSATDLIHRYFGEGRPFRLIVSDEEIDTRTAGGRMLLNVKLAMAQYEAERTAERIRAVKKFLRENGCYQGGDVPYGYRIGKRRKNGARKLKIHKREQAIIRLAVKLHKAGLSLRKSAAVMEDRGVTNRLGRRFGPSQVKRLIDAALAQEEANHDPRRDAEADGRSP